MAIQVRRGLKKDFDPYKLLEGEPAAPTDTKELFVAFAPGDVKKIATYEDMVDNIRDANQEIIEELTAGANAAANICERVLDGNNTFVDPNTGKYYVLKIVDGKPEFEEVPPNPNPPKSSKFNEFMIDNNFSKVFNTMYTDFKDTNIKTGNYLIYSDSMLNPPFNGLLAGTITVVNIGNIWIKYKQWNTTEEHEINYNGTWWSDWVKKISATDIVQTAEVNDVNKVPSSAVTYGLNERLKTTTYTPIINTVVASLLGYQLFEKIGNLVIVKCWLQIVLPSFSVGADYHLMTIPHKPKNHLYFRGYSVNGFGGFIDNCGLRIDTNGDVVIILSGVTSFNRGAGIVIDFTFTT